MWRPLPLIALLACSTAKPIGNANDEPTDAAGSTAVDAALLDAAQDAPTVFADAAAAACPTAPCDLFEQCGCATDEACDLAQTALSGNDCRAIDGQGVEVDLCTTATDCAASYTCVSDGEGTASCKPYCDSDAACAPPRGLCLIQLVSAGTPIPDALVCSSNCDPTQAAAGSCPAGQGCFLYTVNPDGVPGNGDEVPIVDCAPAGTRVQGATCTDYQDCAPDHLCTTTSLGVRRCLRMCANVTGACAAQANTTCRAFSVPHIVGGTQYGVCL